MFPTNVNCDVELSSLPLPVKNCLLCAGKAVPWSAAPNGTACILTFDALDLVNTSANNLLNSMFDCSFNALPGNINDPYGAIAFLIKNTTKNSSEKKLALQFCTMAQEPIDMKIPVATDKLIVDFWVHQNGKDIFICGNAAINAPTVIKSLLSNTVERFWHSVPTLHTTTFLLLWSCLTDHGAVQAYLKNMPMSLAVVVLCFEGPAMLMECVAARNELLQVIVYHAGKFESSFEAAQWLVKAVCSTTSIKMREICKPVVVEKNNVLRVQERNEM